MKKSMMQKMRDFPIRKMRTIQNYTTQLNAEGYKDGFVWEATIIKEEGVIRAKRVS